MAEIGALLKRTETFNIYSFTPYSYREYYLPANTRLFLIIFGSAERKRRSQDKNKHLLLNLSEVNKYIHM